MAEGARDGMLRKASRVSGGAGGGAGGGGGASASWTAEEREGEREREWERRLILVGRRSRRCSTRGSRDDDGAWISSRSGKPSPW